MSRLENMSSSSTDSVVDWLDILLLPNTDLETLRAQRAQLPEQRRTDENLATRKDKTWKGLQRKMIFKFKQCFNICTPHIQASQSSSSCITSDSGTWRKAE